MKSDNLTFLTCMMLFTPLAMERFEDGIMTTPIMKNERKTILSKKQKKVRSKNSSAKKSRKINRKK